VSCRTLLAALLGGCAALTACGSGSLPATPGVVRVVAAENVWGDIAKQIGGDHVEVTSIIASPTADPHLFESDPRTAGAIATAQLVIENGLGYDGFVEKTIAAVGDHGQRVLSVGDVLDLGRLADVNPHVWYDVPALPEVAAAIARQLSTIDPADRSAFEGGARRFVASLKPIRSTIAKIRRTYAGTPVGYTERLPADLLDAAGLEVASPTSFAQAIEDGNDPSPGDLVAFERVIREHKIKVLIYNAQVTDPVTRRIRELAVGSGVPVVGMTEMLPPNTTFQAWQLRQARELLRALGG
jgi:zinc/manganese transport system substrate-binding protein